MSQTPIPISAEEIRAFMREFIYKTTMWWPPRPKPWPGDLDGPGPHPSGDPAGYLDFQNLLHRFLELEVNRERMHHFLQLEADLKLKETEIQQQRLIKETEIQQQRLMGIKDLLSDE